MDIVNDFILEDIKARFLYLFNQILTTVVSLIEEIMKTLR